MFTEENLKKLFTRKFKKKLKESLIPFPSIKREEIIKTLAKEIKTYTYHPSPPRDYIIVNKHRGVARIIPTFTAKDYFLYYTCIKFIEDELAENRVDGTYGGWRIGNKIRFMEQQEEKELMIESYVFNSFNPFLWKKNWTDFQKKAALHAKKYEHMLFMDIANFYDTIDLSILKRKIYLAVPKEKYRAVELLFYFLENWNKAFEGYSKKNIGIPQEEFGDNSRLLANFYLQDFDEKIKEISDTHGTNYLRYADDMILFSDNEKDLKYILYEASKELYKLGLHINSGKIKIFNREEFNNYWAFEIFDLLEKEEYNYAIEKYFTFKDNGIDFRKDSVLKRFLNIKDFLEIIEPSHKHKLLSEIFNKDFISMLTPWHLSKIYNILEKENRERKNFLKILNELIDEIFFNSFHYSVLYFLNKEGIESKSLEKSLKKKIEELKLIK